MTEILDCGGLETRLAGAAGDARGAITVFALAAPSEPGSADAWDSDGDGLAAGGKRA